MSFCGLLLQLRSALAKPRKRADSSDVVRTPAGGCTVTVAARITPARYSCADLARSAPTKLAGADQRHNHQRHRGT
eukprot:6182234-Pleurochrysis_carterae.AAC.2